MRATTCCLDGTPRILANKKSTFEMQWIWWKIYGNRKALVSFDQRIIIVYGICKEFLSHMIHAWYIYLHLVDFSGICRYIHVPHMDPMGFRQLPCFWAFSSPDPWTSTSSTRRITFRGVRRSSCGSCSKDVLFACQVRLHGKRRQRNGWHAWKITPTHRIHGSGIFT